MSVGEGGDEREAGRKVMSDNELNEAAAIAMGWSITNANDEWNRRGWCDAKRVFQFWPCDWLPVTSIEQAFMVQEEVERRGKSHEFSVLLGMAVMNPNTGWQDWRDTWAIANATARQRTEAAVAALSETH